MNHLIFNIILNNNNNNNDHESYLIDYLLPSEDLEDLNFIKEKL